MKKQQKILIVVAIVALLAVSCFAFAACGKKYVQQKDTAVYFTVDKDVMANVDGKTLQDYMDALVKKDQLTYSGDSTAYDLMINTVNDIKADANKGEYWFLYSDDDEYSNGDWGTYDLNGKTYKSTTLGASSLPIKIGCTYVLMMSVSTY